MCLDCHTPWNKGNTASATETHPIIEDYDTVAAAANAAADPGRNPQDRFNLSVDNTLDNSLAAGSNGQIQLVENVNQAGAGVFGVSCTSCHGVHHTDSDSNTLDDPVNVGVGDGYMLRSDGPGSANKSALCQACHNYTPHGDGGTFNSSSYADATGGMGDQGAAATVGCLECHGGHSYDSTTPQAYVLRDQFGASYNSATLDPSYDYDTVPGGYQQVAPWNDGSSLTNNGYCEKCHGDASAIPGSQHNDVAECLNCHFHNDADYSFKPGANVAVCGDCHGFPPTLNIQGDRKANKANEGGYAFISASNNYTNAPNFKDESTTPHAAHAAANVLFASDHPNVSLQDTPVGLDTDYRMGDGEVACSTCHGVRAAHNTDDLGVGIGTYEDLDFDSRAAVDGQAAPAYDGAGRETCDNIYCHSNGGRRNGDNPTESTRSWSFVETPYVGATSSGWDGAKDSLITATYGDSTECATCHGNDVATMSARGNSAAHAVHIGATYNYDCNVCHVNTATSSVYVPKDARDVSKNGSDPTLGTHVNYKVDVDFDPDFRGGLISGASYNASAGTCAVACHAASTPDWDSSTPLNCDSCHAGRPGDGVTINTGSHGIHIDDTRADIACYTCHGGSADDGGHPGHIDGVTTYAAPSANFADVCNECHGVEQVEGPPGTWTPVNAWDTDPVWTNTTSEDCRTCHTGSETTSYSSVSSGVIAAPIKAYALTAGHNTSAPYGAPTNNPAANKNCNNCHVEVTAATSHVDGLLNGNRLVVDFACQNCHTNSPLANGGLADWSGLASRKVSTHNNETGGYTKKPYNAPFTKACLACHDPHGTPNLAMIYRDRNDQNNQDGVAGKFSGDVVLNKFNVGDVPGADGFDENDGVNADDLCATCHTTTLHNNQAATGSHKEEQNCTTTCHAHDSSLGGFMPSGGTACSDCHGNPPTAGDPRYATNGTAFGAHEMHVWIVDDGELEDRSDCAICHPGSDSYTLGHTDGGGIVLAAGIQAEGGGNYTCGTLNSGLGCHASTVTDGFWKDTADYAGDGLSCDSCHGGLAGDSSPIATASHAPHVSTKSLTCDECHPNVPTDTVHITNWDSSGATDNDDVRLLDRAVANGNEADVIRTDMSWTSPSCSSGGPGFALGCHATGEPDWGVPASGNTCIACHDDTITSGLNPTSGLHGGTLTVTGNNHDDNFDDGNLGSADCETCHNDGSGNPSSAHIDGTFDASTANFATAVNFDGVPSPVTCAPSGGLAACHSDGGAWQRKWDASARNNDSSECANCHGVWGNWATGVNHRSNAAPQAKHGTGTYQCRDCHSLQAVSGNYVFTSGIADWGAPNYETSNHGDGSITINDEHGTFTRSALSGCSQCHSASDGTADGQYAFTPTSWPLDTSVVGDEILTLCSDCHGGIAYSGDEKNFWPDGANAIDDGSRNNSGEHEVHIVQLVKAAYPGDFVPGDAASTIANLLTNSSAGTPGVTSETKQKEICSYCHDNPGVNPGHNDDGPLPVNTNSFYTLWDKSADDGSYNGGDGSCATTDCHNNNTPAGYGWYDGVTSDCDMCHVDIDTENTHQDHLNASGTFGINSISCVTCHGSGTTATTPPDNNHINGSFTVDGGTVMDGTTNQYVNFTYPGTKGTCGTNDCHQDGKGATPNIDIYNWDTTGLADCTLCHLDSPPTGAHAKHLANTALVSCTDCHDDVADNATHIDGLRSYNSLVISAAPGDGSCTNSCHLADVTGDWSGGPSRMACTDCHASGSGYVGDNGGAYLYTSGLHAVSATNVTPHDDTIPGGAGCESCHTAYGSEPGSHMDGTWLADGPNNEGGAQPRFVNRSNMTYNELAVNYSTCSGTGLPTGNCHSDGGEWSRLWSTEADVDYMANPDPGQAVCNVCHGQYSSLNAKGWRAGTSHFAAGNSASENKGDTHASADPTADKCERCHGYDTVGNHDQPTHEIDFSGDGTTAGGNFNVAAGATGVYCDSCHFNQRDEPATDTGSHTFPTSTAFTGAKNYAGGALLPEGGCTSCHGTALGGYWPDGAGPKPEDDEAGEHQAHLDALALKVYGETAVGNADNDITVDNTTLNSGLTSDEKQKALCEYCHAAVANDSDHMSTLPADVFIDADTNRHSKFMDGTTDTNASFNPAGNGTCSNIDCHNGKATNVETIKYDWKSGSSSDCEMCHNALDNTHSDHMNAQTNNFGIGIVCTDCHGDGVTASNAPSNNHIDGTFQIGNTATNSGVAFDYDGSYTDVATNTQGSCGTNDCHEDGTGNSPATPTYNWGTIQPDCTLCHDQTSGRHADHPDTSAYIATGCVDCHTGADQTSHIDNSLNVGGTSNLSYTNPGCTNDCHLINGDGATYGDWLDAQPLACVDCHSAGSYIGGGANLPATGLHATGTALAHNDNFDGGKTCTDCHTTIPTSTHLDNNLDSIGAGYDTNVDPLTWNWDAQVGRYIYYGAGDTRCSSSCHDDQNDWLRRWKGVDDAKPVGTEDPAVATVCGNCHGSFNMLWNGPSTSHTNPYDQGGINPDGMGNHQECAKCHGWGNTEFDNYDETWANGTHGATPRHGDGYISMNGPLSTTTGAQYDNATGGCADACHSVNYVMNSASGFPEDYADFGAGGCNLCHGGEAGISNATLPYTDNYWPDADPVDSRTSGTQGPAEREGAHLKHVSAIADSMDGADGAYTQENANNSCIYCHPNPGGTNVDAAFHNNNTLTSPIDTADVSGDTWNSGTYLKGLNLALDTDATYDDGAQTCAAVSCHGNAAATPAWDSVPSLNTAPPLTYGLTIDDQIDEVGNYVTITQGDPVILAGVASDTSDGGDNVTDVRYMIDSIPSGGAGTQYDTWDGPDVLVNFSATIATGGWTAGEHAVYAYAFDNPTDGWGPVGHATVNVITADSVTVTTTDIAVQSPTKVVKSTVTPMLRLDITTPMDQSTYITSLTVDELSNAGADIERCYIYLDNGDGIFSTIDDTAIGEAQVTGGSTPVTIASTKADNFGNILYVAYLVSSSATNDNTFNARVTAMTIDAEDSISGVPTITSSDSTVKPPDLGDATTMEIFPSGTATGHSVDWTAGNWVTDLDAVDSNEATVGKASRMNLAMDNTGLVLTSAISKVVVTVEGRRGAAGDEGLDIGLADTTSGTTFYSGTNGADYGAPLTMPMTEEFTTNPETGLAWKVAEVNNIVPAVLAVNGSGGFGDDFWVDMVKVEVFYAPALPEATTPPLTYGVTANGSGPEITISKGSALTLSAIVDDAGGGNEPPIAEYFLDTDPGEGNGTSMSIVTGGGTATITFDDNGTIDTSAAEWTVGKHFLYVRGNDSDGWGGSAAVVVNITAGDGVSVSFANKAPVVAELGIRYPMLNLQFNLDGAGDSEAQITDITVDMTTTGTAHGDDASLISIFDDSGSDFGNWDSNDSLVGQTVFPSAAAPTSVLIDIDDQMIDATGKALFVVAGISPSGTPGNSFAVAVDPANITISAPDTMLTVGAGSSNEVTLEQSAIVCGQCHAIPMSSGKHSVHANGDTDPGDCIRCHGDNSGYGYSTHPRGTHNDGNSEDLSELTVQGGGGWNSGTRTCSTEPCHYNQDSPNWDSGSADCSYCHGNGNGTNVPWPAASSHENHINAFGFATLTDVAAPAVCNSCHLGAGGGSPNHGNGNRYDVVINPMFDDKSPGSPSYSGGATGTCGNVSCHGGQTTPAWSNTAAVNSINLGLTGAAQTAECRKCHDFGNSEYNGFQSGKHQLHIFSGNKNCDDCHDSLHADHFKLAELQTAPMLDPNTPVYTVGPGAGSYIDTTTYSPTSGLAFDATGDSGTCSNTGTGCHGGNLDTAWNPTAAGNCTFCHGYPPTGDGGPNDMHASGVTPVDHEAISNDEGVVLFDKHDDCTVCHGTKALTDPSSGIHAPETNYSVSGDHRDGQIEMNSDAGYDEGTFGCNNAGACHSTGPNDPAHQLSDSGMTVEFAQYGVGSCTACHAVGSGGAPVVSGTSPHIGTNYATDGCEACHSGHAPEGAPQAGEVKISTITGRSVVGGYGNDTGTLVPTLNNQYASHDSWILLGGTVASGNTEAEICWSCHDTVGRSEWGKTWGAYDTGSLDTSDWTTAKWTSANFAYKSTTDPGLGAIQSTHGTGKYDTTLSDGMNAKSEISCTYCHDVHDTGGGVNDASSPYLRGNWISNPFKEDGAPQTTAHATVFGGVPRAGLGSATLGDSPNAIGGWQIEQNNPGAYTRSGDYATHSELCSSCHTMTDLQNRWSGHRSVVDGFTNTGGANIFSTSKRGGTADAAVRGYMQHSTTVGTNDAKSPEYIYGIRSTAITGIDPQINPAKPENPNIWAGWADLSVDSGSVDQGFHQFPCAKCHNPHASRLPKLMITNCLDVSHNAWDDAINPSASTNHGYNATELAYSSTAANCHRYVDTNDNVSNGGAADDSEVRGPGNSGWNSVTPW
jgi:predicted CxxxxCH...CXXCH cytochrome family protein